MKKKFYILLFFILLLWGFQSCKNNSYSNGSSEVEGYEDGTYCADIEYYYSKSGTNSSYTLEIEVEDNELVKIYWPNGGWLDDSHFSPPDISDGEAIFESDKGVEYTVKIVGKGGCNYSSSAPDEDEFVKENEDEICPECGGRKYSSEEMCEDCQDEICPECGGRKYSSEEMCEDCQDEICPECGGRKYSSEEICDDCQDEVCPECGGRKYSSDEICDDCERKKEDEERKKEQEEREKQEEEN
jgi:hypothetical protein